MSELLPCPFCPEGENPEYKLISTSGAFDVHLIYCPECGISKQAHIKEVAVERWNTRHYPPEVEKAVERMKPMKALPAECNFVCPSCNGVVPDYREEKVMYCESCGQALDWSDE